MSLRTGWGGIRKAGYYGAGAGEQEVIRRSFFLKREDNLERLVLPSAGRRRGHRSRELDEEKLRIDD